MGMSHLKIGVEYYHCTGLCGMKSKEKLEVVFLQCYKLHTYIYVYTGCPRRKGRNFGRVFLMLKYTDITQNTYIQS